MSRFFILVRQALQTGSVDDKIFLTRQAALELHEAATLPGYFGEAVPVESPGRPDRPRLVPAARVPRRGFGTAAGRAVIGRASCRERVYVLV